MLEHVHKLNKDLKEASFLLSAAEARFLVDAYYIIQEDRKRSNNQLLSLENAEEPNAILQWFADNNRVLEDQIKDALNRYSKNHPIGKWLHSVKGIGPVIAAGLLAHLSIRIPQKDPFTKETSVDENGNPLKIPCEAVGNWWSFAGLDPRRKWGKGEKIPWNAALKTLCWKTGESFCKFSTGDNPAYYGIVYRHRKSYEIAKNEAGDYRSQAESALATKRWEPSTAAYKAYMQGKLPAAQIDKRAKRYAVKFFLSHLHHVWYKHEFGKDPAKPYAIAHLGHKDFVPPPNLTIFSDRNRS